MELQWDLRPVSMVHRPQDWNEAPDNGPALPSTSSSAYYPHRRRSTVAPVPSPGPPPSQPIPSLPLGSSTPPPPQENVDESRLSSVYLPALSGNGSSYNAYSRPAASPSLAAVAAFSQSRLAPSPNYNYTQPTFSLPASSSFSAYNLSDSPPRSQLRPAIEPQHQDIMPDRLLLSPSEPPPPNERRPSSRRALTRALELAREAVRLDSTNDDPYAAIAAYGRSVSLLSEVMERVIRGEDTTESHRRRNGRRRSIIAQEEEVRRLRSIHDTYAERMNILSLIYNIPVGPHSPSSVYPSSMSASTDSTQPSSPDSLSGSSDNPLSASSAEDLPDVLRSSSTRTMKVNGVGENDDGTEAIGSAMFNLNVSGSSSGPDSPSTVTTPHPMSPVNPSFVATTPVEAYPQGSTNGVPSGRSRIPPFLQARNFQGGPIPPRSRAPPTLPPPPPPPTNALPPAPAPAIVEPPPESRSSRPRGSSVSHKKTGSGNRLRALNEEEHIRHFEAEDELRRPRSKSVLATQRHYNDSQPLPPLPSPVDRSASAIIPHHAKPGEQSVPPSSDLQNFITSRARGDSITSEANVPSSTPSPVIDASPINGTISLRRGKTSAPPSTQGSPNLESGASIPTLNRLTGSSLPATAASSLGMGRTRAASQPGGRPSLVSIHTYTLPTQPTVPGQSSAPGSRKVSVPSKLNPNAPPQIMINTAQLSPLTASTATMLVPPPPIPPENLPSAPMSPLPPAPPPDPLRKPYHMMNLLRRTMVSKTGGYVTRRLHVPFEVWSQGGAKLSNIPEKIRVVEVLLSALEEVQNCSTDIFGAGNVSSGLILGIGSIGKKDGEAWGTKLEEFSAVCDGLVSNFGKKLGVGEGFVTKKSGGLNAWGTKLTRQFDKLTTGKNLDSPTTYVHGLAKLFLQTQLLDEHTKALLSTPVAPTYAAFSIDMRTALEAKLRHASEFFAKVVLTFVIRDLSQLLDKYVKKCEKWLAE